MKILEFPLMTLKPTLPREDEKGYWISALIGLMWHAHIKNWLQLEVNFFTEGSIIFFLLASWSNYARDSVSVESRTTQFEYNIEHNILALLLT